MKWAFLGFAAAVSLLCGLLGLTIGLNLNPASTVKFVPTWGSLGDWVAGLGAILALGVALWQSFVQSQKDRIRTLVLDRSDSHSWALRLVSEGLIPVTVLGVDVQIKDLRFSLPMTAHPDVNFHFPVRLERGDVQQVIELRQDGFAGFADALMALLISAVEGRGLRPGNGDYGVNPDYFQTLKIYCDSRPRLIIRLAHDDIKHDLDKGPLGALLSSALTKLEEQELSEARQRKQKDYECLSKALRPHSVE